MSPAILAAFPALISGAGSALSSRRPLSAVAASSTLHTNQLHRRHHEKGVCKEWPGFPSFRLKNTLIAHMGALLAMVGERAFAVTGENNYEIDWTANLIDGVIVAFVYFIVMPPIIMNWLRVRWRERKFFEMYVQFMFVFIFFPGLLLWAPFLNFRQFPRDPSMKYPWSTPKDLQ